MGLALPLVKTTSNALGDFILIYSGASATGVLAIRFAKLSGLRVLTTCSPSNFEQVKALGAEAAFDYVCILTQWCDDIQLTSI